MLQFVERGELALPVMLLQLFAAKFRFLEAKECLIHSQSSLHVREFCL